MKQIHVIRTRNPLAFTMADALAAIGRAPSFHPAFRSQALAKTKRIRDAANKRGKRGNVAAATVAKHLGARVA